MLCAGRRSAKPTPFLPKAGYGIPVPALEIYDQNETVARAGWSD